MEATDPAGGSEQRHRPRVKSWLGRGHGATFAWLLPVLVVAITGWLGSFEKPLLLASWLAVIGAGAAGVVTNVALEPAPYAARIAAAFAAVIGVGLLVFLTWQAGHPLLR